jgi:hypothetical protein
MLKKDQIQACSSSFVEQPLSNSNFPPINLLQTNKPKAHTSSDGLVNQIHHFGALDRHLQAYGSTQFHQFGSVQEQLVSHSLQTNRSTVQDQSFGLENQDVNLIKLQQLQNSGLLQASQFDNRIQIQPFESSNQNQSRDNLNHVLATTPTETIQSFEGDPYLQTFNPQEQIISNSSAYPTDVTLGHMSCLNHQERYLHSQREIVPIVNTPIYQGKNTSSL